MSDSDEKLLPFVRLLLVAFFGLLFVLALQLFLLVTGANAGITEAHRNIAPLVSASSVRDANPDYSCSEEKPRTVSIKG